MILADLTKEFRRVVNDKRDEWELSKLSAAEPRRFMLDNGMKGAIQYSYHSQDVMEATLLVKAGSAHDPPGKEGTAHFLEHVLYDREAVKEFEKRQGILYAATSGSNIIIQATIPHTPENQSMLIGWLKEVVTSPKLSDSNIDIQRKRILNEFGFQKDHPEEHSQRLFSQHLYSAPQAIFGNVGPKDIIRTIEKEDMENYQKRYFNASNMVLAIKTPAKNVRNLEREIENIFNDLPEGDPAEEIKPEFLSMETRQNTPFEQLYFSYGFNIPAATQGEEAVANIYAEYMRLLVDRDMVESGLVYNSCAVHKYLGCGPSFLQIYGNIIPEDAGDVAPAIATAVGRTAHTIEPDLFNVAKNNILFEFSRPKETWEHSRQTLSMAYDLAFEDRLPAFWEKFHATEAVTPDDLTRFAREKILHDPPALLAYGDSTNLHTKAEFEAMLAKEAQTVPQPQPEHKKLAVG